MYENRLFHEDLQTKESEVLKWVQLSVKALHLTTSY